MSSWDAAIILQALARRFLARKLYLEIKASIAYQTLVVGRAKDSDHEDQQNLLTDTFCCRSDEDLVTNAQNEVASDSGKVPGNNSSYVCYTDSKIDDRQQKSPSIGLLCFSSNADSDLNENEFTRASVKLLGNKSADGCDDLPETQDQHRIRDADMVRNAQNDMADASIRQLEGDGTTYHVNEAKSEEKEDDCEVEAQNVIDKHHSRDPPASAIGNCGVEGNEKATEPDKFMELNYRIPPAAHSVDDEDGVNLNDKYFMESPKATYFDFAEKKQCENIYANHQALNVNKSAELSDRDVDGRRCLDPTPFSQNRPVATHGGRDETYQINPDHPMKKEILKSGTATLKRNVLAEVACKFDDAVSKVVKNMTSLVTCTSNANAFDGATEIDRIQSSSGETASVATISMRHDKFVTTESRRKMASTQIMYRLKSGWRLANASCPACQMPTMFPPGGHEKFCVVCSEAVIERNLSMRSASDRISRDTGDGIVSNAIRSTIPNNTSYEQSRQISGEISRRLNSGWLVVAAVCPACKIPLMKSPVDDLDHCLSCGPMNSRFSTFHLSSNSSSSQDITHCNNALARVGNYNEFGINDCVRHPELTGQPAFVNDYYANQYSHAPNFHDDPNTFVHQTQRCREPPNPHKPLRNCYYNGEPVNGIVMNMREGRDYEMKENSYSVANYAGSMQPASAAALSAIEEAKMRIENAKRHITNSKALRVPPGTGNLNIYDNLGSGSSTFGSSGTFRHHY